MDFLAIASNGYYPSGDPSNAVRSALASSYGLILQLYQAIVSSFFSDGDILIRQPFSEDYCLNGTKIIIRLPWSEDYASGSDTFIRQPFSEDYCLNNSSFLARLPFSEDYIIVDVDKLMFIRQPFSENYKVKKI